MVLTAYWELLPKEILGATTQRDTGSYYPKRYSELLPKEILEDLSQNSQPRFYSTTPSKDELISFIQELGYYGKCDMLSAIHTDQMHQPWRTFAAIINWYIFGKTTGLDRLKESRAKVLWGMYNLKNVDYVILLWEDFMYQDDNQDISTSCKEHMPYPRFTKVIINHFISKDKTISMTNKINLNTVRDEFLLGTLKFVSKTEDYQKYGAVIPDGMINQDIKASKAYKTYHDFAIGKVAPKKARKFKKKFTTIPTAGVSIRDTPGVSVSKKKSPAKGNRGKGMELLSDAALLEAAQVLDESQDKTTGTDERTGTKPGVLDVSKDHSESENESWGDSKGADSNDDVSDDVSKGDDDDDVDSAGDGDNDASDNESTDSAEEENPNLTLKDDEEEETQDNEYVHTSDSYASTDEETNDDYREFDGEEYDELYKDVNVTSNVTKHAKKGKETKGSMQSSSVSSDFASKFLNLDNVPPADNEVASMMNFKVNHEESSTQAPPLLTVPITAIPVTSTAAATTVTLIITPITPIPQLLTPNPVPTTELMTSSIPTLPDFTSLFGFNQRVSALEQELSQKKAQPEKEKYINIIEKSVKEIIKDEVKSQLPQILPKDISDFATPVVQNTINELLENVVLAKSSSYPQLTYEAATSLIEDLYDALVKSYQLNKDLFDSYGKVYSLKRGHEDKDKDEDPPAGLDQGLKKRKTSKDAEPPTGSKSKESKSSSSKGTKSQPKTSGKSKQAEELVFETADTEMPQDQGGALGNTEDQPNVEEASKHDWFKKPERPPTPNLDWNAGKQIDFRPPQT
ncbi:hypothetical protein Tco_0843160 [Tanacetum coccineum]|uniref:Uncharacterized protein n=1 Tax=Tanacetum coccineum TaxID=301880 RepID=A0ABQ5B4J9_9ASTR